MKRDSGPSELPARIRGRLSLPTSVSILKRKAWDMGCPLLPQPHGWQQVASSWCATIQQMPVSFITALLPQKMGHEPHKNPFAGYCVPPAHSLLCASSEHTALSGFPTACQMFNVCLQSLANSFSACLLDLHIFKRLNFQYL